MGGSNEREGNLLVGNRPVCDDLWSLEDATVACKQLGFPGVCIMYLISRSFSVKAKRSSQTGNEREGNLLVGNCPVCDDLWSLEDATVACKMLGFPGVCFLDSASFYT